MLKWKTVEEAKGNSFYLLAYQGRWRIFGLDRKQFYNRQQYQFTSGKIEESQVEGMEKWRNLPERYKAIRKSSYTLEVQNNFKDFTADEVCGCMDEEQLPQNSGTEKYKLDKERIFALNLK